jgi:outer membrane receptor for ferrienterochelin and colicins
MAQQPFLPALFFFIFSCISGYGQQVSGLVTNQMQHPLAGATVYSVGTGKSVVTSETGRFALELSGKVPEKIIVSHTGYISDTLTLTDTLFLNVVLKDTAASTNVVVRGYKRQAYIASSAIKTEVITSLELKKAACCDLAGCFETQGTVQPQTTNIITNSKELRILGLSGIYNQVLIDGFPQIQGLSYTYGISSTPGSLVENIFVSKGANSVLQGFESISGQINVLTKEPDKTDKLLLNAYINSFSEKHLNVVYAFKKKKWSNLTAFHMVQPAGKFDKDEDTFLDLPLLTRYMVSNRWKKGDENKWGWSTQVGLKYLYEQRIGGQTHFNYEGDKGTTKAYGQAVALQQPEVWFKTAYRLNEKHRFAFYSSGFYQAQQSWFGVTGYKAKQTNGYTNLQYELTYKTNSVLKTGASFRYLNLSETISFTENSLNRTYAGQYDKKETIPGIFAENTLTAAGGKLTWILGVRADKHNQFGWQVTPRTLLKWDFAENMTVRGSVGTGWRTANIFSENIGMLASSRDIIFEEILNPEKAVNMGINATWKFKRTNFEGYASLDFYHTSFQNQIFPDYDRSPTVAYLSNFTGTSVSNGFQAEVSGTFYNRFSAKVGYVYLDVYQEKNDARVVLPFNPKHRVQSAASFMPLSRKWHIDANVHWYGIQRLPDTESNPEIYQRPGTSEPYSIVNLQYTHTLGKFELYAGCENIFNFRQNQPIISWQEPFGPYFDTQFAWGPTRGREAYMGVRFMLK